MKQEKWQLTPQKYKGLRKYNEQLHDNKLNNLVIMDKFLETYNLQKLNQEESENLNRQITPSEMEEVVKKLPTNKSSEQDGFTVNFIKHSENN